MESVLGFFRAALVVSASAALTVFVVQNLEPVEMSFMTWTMSAPRALNVLASVALGGVLGAFATLAASRRS